MSTICLRDDGGFPFTHNHKAEDLEGLLKILQPLLHCFLIYFFIFLLYLDQSIHRIFAESPCMFIRRTQSGFTSLEYFSFRITYHLSMCCNLYLKKQYICFNCLTHTSNSYTIKFHVNLSFCYKPP